MDRIPIKVKLKILKIVTAIVLKKKLLVRARLNNNIHSAYMH